MPFMNAFVKVICPECKVELEQDCHEKTVFCITLNCTNYGIEFEIPTIKLKKKD
jgi:hypothetical protein